MARQINPIRKAKLKQALLNGETAKDSLLEAGYTSSTADRSTMNKSVQICQREILQELKAKDITVDYLVNSQLKGKEMAIAKGDLSNYHRADENLARFTGIDKQNVTINNVILTDLSNKDPEMLTRLAKNRRA